MEFTNSPLVCYTKISPNKNVDRQHEIDTITIHCVVGQLSVETLGKVFESPSKQASSNYGIGSDGRIGMYVEEKDRSWCSSSRSNDHRAVTIEVASDTTSPYAVNEKAYASLINLVSDICVRNGIKELKWKADKSLVGQVDKQNMTVHRWFANKSCPGDYLYSKMGDIASEVNARIVKKSEPISETSAIKIGDVVAIVENATYYKGGKIPQWVKTKNWIVSEVKGDRAVIDKSEDGKYAIKSPINTSYLSVVNGSAPKAEAPKVDTSYKVRIEASALNIRKGPGLNYAVTGVIRDRGIYTIVDEKSGWGKLKSGAGWIALNYTKKV